MRVMNVAAIAPVRKITRREYDQLIDMGWFRDERIELIDGLLVAVSPQGPLHAEAVTRLNTLLLPRLLGRATVRIQLPLGVGPVSEPEPDVAVVSLATYSHAHPEAAHLVVEVADSSVATDRLIKSRLYARHGIPEYWLLDLRRRSVEVFRAPQEGIYTDVFSADEAGHVSPLAFPDVVLSVRDLLPPTG